MGTENVTPSQDALPRKRRRQICSINPSPPAISKLGDDLLVEILIRLPNPGSACRSKPVCKLWNSLVSDPSFNRRSVSRRQSINEQEPPPPLLPSDDPQSIVLSFLPVPAEAREYFRVLDSFKDLVLCGFREAYSYRMKEEFSRLYLVCNPFTKQWIALPLAPSTRQDARLVCEPRVSNNLDLGGDDDDDQEVCTYSEYRFRVACMDQGMSSICMFCSEQGEWINESFDLHHYNRTMLRSAVSCSGELFFLNHRSSSAMNPYSVAALNLFSPDHLSAIYIDVAAVSGEWLWNVSVSRGALHLVGIQEKPMAETGGCSRFFSSVWRLESHRKSWEKLCEGFLKAPPSSCKYGISSIRFHCLHPERPEIVFYGYRNGGRVIMSRDLSTGRDVEFGELRLVVPHWRLFQPKVSCWPTPIASYEELRDIYDESCRSLIQCVKAKQQQLA